jgi:DNA-binding transcriptional regulator YiaG
MGYVLVMTLDKYLKTSKISSRAFAENVGVSIHAVSKWRQKVRIPRPSYIEKIKALTAGKVKPADWYR